MALGVPRVVNDDRRAARIVGDTGVLVPPGDSGARGAAWHRVLAVDEERWTELGRAARRHIEPDYGMPKVVDHYENPYLSVGSD
jgi:glycosyltransferase involved in cell wall biosynthesis